VPACFICQKSRLTVEKSQVSNPKSPDECQVWQVCPCDAAVISHKKIKPGNVRHMLLQVAHPYYLRKTGVGTCLTGRPGVLAVELPWLSTISHPTAFRTAKKSTVDRERRLKQLRRGRPPAQNRLGETRREVRANRLGLVGGLAAEQFRTTTHRNSMSKAIPSWSIPSQAATPQE